MKKDELIEAVMSAAGLDSKRQAADAVDAVFDTITKTLSRGDEVAVSGFGTFRAAKRAARQARNPRTGETVQVPASIAPKFKAGKALKDAVNS